MTSEQPLVKVTLNLFEADVEWLKARHGWGYSTAIRDIVHRDVTQKTDLEPDHAKD